MQNQSNLTPRMEIGHPHIRPRRLRTTEKIRDLVQENHLRKSDLIWPVFVSEPGTPRFAIPTLPGVDRIPYEEVLKEVESAVQLGLCGIMLFPVIDKSKKDLLGKEALNPDGLIQKTIRQIKTHFPDLLIFADVALDPYTTHGHDGIVDASGQYVLNDETTEVLCKQALSYAQCGIDFVCPSDMMDGRIGAIRKTLDHAGYINTGILAYTAKFASAFYGPFRQAVDSGARHLDKKTYQLNPANLREAIRETHLDIQEGADIIMVKPGICYLDILSEVKKISPVPVAIYQISGEYAMLKLAAQNNIIDEKSAVYETLLCMKRAGADTLVTYYAKWACENLF